MIPSIENLFKRGVDLYYSRRHSYPLFEIEFRPDVDDEWIYEVTIRGNNGKVVQLRYTKFDDNIIVGMVESLLNSEDMANIELSSLLQREYTGEIRNTGERVHIEPMGDLVRDFGEWYGINTINPSSLERPRLCIERPRLCIERPTSIDFDPEEEV